MKDFIKWLNLNYTSVMKKLRNNNRTFEELEANIIVNQSILKPTSALELAEVFEETLNLVAILEASDVNEVELPEDIKLELIELGKDSLNKIGSVANAELVNNGNLALFINHIINKEPINLALVNFNKRNAIDIDFNSFNGFEVAEI